MNGSTELTEVIKTIPIEKVDTNIYILSNCSYLEFGVAVRLMFDDNALLQLDYSRISNVPLDRHYLNEHGLDYRVYKFECYNNDEDRPVFKAYLDRY